MITNDIGFSGGAIEINGRVCLLQADTMIKVRKVYAHDGDTHLLSWETTIVLNAVDVAEFADRVALCEPIDVLFSGVARGKVYITGVAPNRRSPNASYFVTLRGTGPLENVCDSTWNH